MGKTASEIHFNKIARRYDYYKNKNSFYYENLKKLLRDLIPKDKTVLEFGCGTGDLLASLKPKVGYGVDISSEMIRIANAKHSKESQIHFSTVWPKGKFDCIFMSDVVEHLDNPKETFRKIRDLMDNKTTFVCTMANPIWEPILLIAEKLGLKMPEGPHKRIAFDDLRFMIQESGMRMTKHDYTLLMPIKIPIITHLANKYLEKHLKTLAFIEYFVVKVA